MEKKVKILEVLLQIPPDFNTAGDELNKLHLSSEEISSIAWDYVQECVYEDDGDPDLTDISVGEGTVYWKEPEINKDWHSAYLV